MLINVLSKVIDLDLHFFADRLRLTITESKSQNVLFLWLLVLNDAFARLRPLLDELLKSLL